MNKLWKWLAGIASAVSAGLVIALQAVLLRQEKEKRKKAEKTAERLKNTAQKIIESEKIANEQKEKISSGNNSDNLDSSLCVLHKLSGNRTKPDKLS